jgi:site-specific recombinase XerD
LHAEIVSTHSLDITDVAGQLSTRSKRIYQNDATMFAGWMNEQSLAPEILTRSHMIAYRSFLAETYQKATAQRMFSVARRILQEQVLNGKLLSNPAEGIKGFKVANETTHTALTKTQAKDLLSSVDTSTAKGVRDYALLMLLLRTGLRRSECAALNIGDIKQEQGHTVAIIEHGKGDKKGVAKLPVDVFRAIQAYIEVAERQQSTLDAPLFTGFDKGDHPTKARISDKLIERVVKFYGKKIGVPELTPHGLRATFITLALEGGAQLHQVQYAARHSDPRTTERYQKRKLNLDDNAVDYIHL